MDSLLKLFAIFLQTTQHYNFRQNRNFRIRSVKSVYHGSESIFYFRPKIWEIVPENIKKPIPSRASKQKCVRRYHKVVLADFVNKILVWFFYFFSYFIQSRVFLAVAYLTVANLARLRIQVCCQVSVRSQYLVRLHSQCWITGGHTIHPPITGLLPPTGIGPTPFRNSASKVDGLQVHATTSGYWLFFSNISIIMSFR